MPEARSLRRDVRCARRSPAAPLGVHPVRLARRIAVPSEVDSDAYAATALRVSRRSISTRLRSLRASNSPKPTTATVDAAEGGEVGEAMFGDGFEQSTVLP